MLTDGRRFIALLPMKAHSERVPGKNFRMLAGRPLYRWMLDTLLELGEIDRVIINTDAREILERLGVPDDRRVTIRERAPELRGDLVSMNLVIGDDLAHAPADLYLMTHTTNPLLSAATLRAALDRFSGGMHDSLFSVTKRQARFYREDGSAVNHDPAALLRTQDLEPWFEENSCFYLFTPASFADTGSRIGRRPLMFETTKLESVDIDDEQDWLLAESLAIARQRAGST